MDKLKKFISLFFCKHEWEIVEELRAYRADNDSLIGTKWTSRCKKCGRFKTYQSY